MGAQINNPFVVKNSQIFEGLKHFSNNFTIYRMEMLRDALKALVQELF